MATKKVSQEQVRNVLGVGMFEAKRDIQDTDPIEPVAMKLPIDQVEPYDKNPRRVRNPEYDSILESLRANGQDEALTITRRPGSEKYMIKRGGNTRLEIMKMLYHEAGDERFAEIDCLFKPWSGEADCILGHLTENTTQGEMTLIDKARGYREFKLEYEQEHGIENLGQRKLVALLREKGASINHPALGVMWYALDVLEPAIPETLNRGLGLRKVEKLKRLHQTYERLAEAHDLYEPENREQRIRAEFHRLLSEHDGDDWDLELVIHEFTQRLGEELDSVPFNRLKLDIAECMKRDPWKVDLVSTREDAPPLANGPATEPPPPLEPQQGPAPAQTNTSALQQTTTTDQQPARAPASSSPSTPVTRTPAAATGSTEPSSSANEVPEAPPSSRIAGEFDIKSHRARIHTLALQFAQVHRLHTCIQPLPYGYGYFLDLPKSELPGLNDPERLPSELEQQLVAWKLNPDRDEAARSMAWVLLWMAVGLYDYRTECLIPGIDKLPESKLKETLLNIYSLRPDLPDERPILLFSSSFFFANQLGGVQHTVDLAHACTYIQPAHMMKWLDLMTARTQLQAYAEDNGIDLWEVRS